MPPRRERQSPDREDRDARRRGRPAGNAKIDENARYEISGRDSKIWRPPRGVEPTQGSSAILRLKRKLDMTEEEVTAEDASTERLIRAISRMSSKTKMDIPTMREV
jgi:hypothetical protein